MRDGVFERLLTSVYLPQRQFPVRDLLEAISFPLSSRGLCFECLFATDCGD